MHGIPQPEKWLSQFQTSQITFWYVAIPQSVTWHITVLHMTSTHANREGELRPAKKAGETRGLLDLIEEDSPAQDNKTSRMA